MFEQKILVPAKRLHLPAGRERRARVRYPLDEEVLCHPLLARFDETWWEIATTRDISDSGISLLLFRPVQPGVLMEIFLKGVRPLVLARVMRLVPQSDNGWLVGCAFTSPLRDKDLRALLTGATGAHAMK